MIDELLAYYNGELAFLREMGAEFAARYPKVAARLLLEADKCEDPHVERLLEGVAFLTARIRHKIDDEFPEITDALLGVLYPHYQRPLPSMSVVQFVLGREQAKVAAGYTIDAGQPAQHAAGRRASLPVPHGLPGRRSGRSRSRRPGSTPTGSSSRASRPRPSPCSSSRSARTGGPTFSAAARSTGSGSTSTATGRSPTRSTSCCSTTSARSWSAAASATGRSETVVAARRARSSRSASAATRAMFDYPSRSFPATGCSRSTSPSRRSSSSST